MLKKLLCFIVLVPIMAMGSAYAITCQSNEFKYIDNNSNEECIENKFQITTTNDTDHFVFSMSAKGTFYIDWGDGDVEKIERTNTTMTEYSHDYASANEYIIKFGGQATGYTTTATYNSAAIKFGVPIARIDSETDLATNNTYNNLAGISGSLGAIFPTIGAGGTLGTQPCFESLFRKCANLTGDIPSDLFGRVVNGVYEGCHGVPRDYMFMTAFTSSAFNGSIPETLFGRIINGEWYGLTSRAAFLFSKMFARMRYLSGTNIPDPNNPGMNYAIPPNLFYGFSGGLTGYIMYNLFLDDKSLSGTIPEDLFGREINGVYHGFNGAPAGEAMYGVFRNCKKLTGSIPEKLFSRTINGVKYGIVGATNSNTYSFTFSGCSGLTGSIPEKLFDGISGRPMNNLFFSTFSGCSGLTGPIPADLFKNISGTPAIGTFRETFKDCIGLTGPIPADLFKNISGKPEAYMFDSTFSGCSGLTGTDINDPNNPGMKYAIPSTLFSGISGAPISYMYRHTFYKCSGLTGTIPDRLFGNLNGVPATSMFEQTFNGCSGLTGSIPSNLFQGISGKPQQLMFSQTFRNCTGLTGLPQGLFSGISGAPASSMFNSTFNGCSSLTGFISDDFFGDITGAPANSMFYYTFQGCRNLTGPIPENLFSGIYGKAAYQAFGGVFSNCINLGKDTIGGTSKYYIPPELFAGIDKNTTATEFMTMVFNNTGLLTACPAGTSQYMTGFESYFTNRKSCTECSVNYPNYDSDTQQCYAQLSFVSDDGQTLLRSDDIYYDANYPNGYTLPAYTPTRVDSTLDGFVNGAGTAIGANDVLSGNQVVYPKWSFHCDSDKWWNFKISENESTRMCLCTDKRTEHTIQFNHNGTIYHAMLTPVSEHDYTINKNTPRKLKVNMGGTIYNAYDASVLFDD